MKKLILLLSVLGFLSCQRKEDIPNDVAARASGQYAVQSYVVNGDTLYTSKGINKIGVSEFYIVVDRKKPDSVRVGSFYKKTGEAGLISITKDVGVSETNGTFQLSSRISAPAIYESRITDNAFYERTVGNGVFVLPPAYVLKTPPNPALEGIIISAQK